MTIICSSFQTIVDCLHEKVNKNRIFEISFTVMKIPTWDQVKEMIGYNTFQHSNVPLIASVFTDKISAQNFVIIRYSAFSCIVPNYSCLNNTGTFHDLHSKCLLRQPLTQWFSETSISAS